MWPFKKKEDDLAQFERELGLNPSSEPLREPVDESYDRLNEDIQKPGIEPRSISSMSQPLQQFSQNTDVQIISAKLDTIKAMLDLMNQKLSNLEKNVEEKGKDKKNLW